MKDEHTEATQGGPKVGRDVPLAHERTIQVWEPTESWAPTWLPPRIVVVTNNRSNPNPTD